MPTETPVDNNQEERPIDQYHYQQRLMHDSRRIRPPIKLKSNKTEPKMIWYDDMLLPAKPSGLRFGPNEFDNLEMKHNDAYDHPRFVFDRRVKAIIGKQTAHGVVPLEAYDRTLCDCWHVTYLEVPEEETDPPPYEEAISEEESVMPIFHPEI